MQHLNFNNPYAPKMLVKFHFFFLFFLEKGNHIKVCYFHLTPNVMINGSSRGDLLNSQNLSRSIPHMGRELVVVTVVLSEVVGKRRVLHINTGNNEIYCNVKIRRLLDFIRNLIHKHKYFTGNTVFRR